MDSNSVAAPGTPSGLPAHKLQRVLSVIDTSLARTMHVRQLAESVSLSPFHFARMFKKSTGHSPHAYITVRRMELAKALLADSTLTLLEVGTRAGYQTQAHFTDVFRKHVGMTPGRYRRLCLDARTVALPANVGALEPAAAPIETSRVTPMSPVASPSAVPAR